MSPAKSCLEESINIVKKAFMSVYITGGLGAIYDLYNQIQNGWCSECDTYVLTIKDSNGKKECLACGRTLTSNEVKRTIKNKGKSGKGMLGEQ